MSEINAIHTPCKNCVFAKYEDKTQTDCHLDYINLYKEKKIEVLEAYDEEKEFFIINSKKCIGYRENSWFEKRNLANLSIEDKVKRFREKNYLHYLLVIDLKNLHTEDLGPLTEQLQSLSIQPRKIIFVRHQNDEKKFSYEIIQKVLSNAKLDCKWRIQTMLIEKDHKDILHEIINLNKKYRFILSVVSVSSELNQIVDYANTLVYKDMKSFIVIRNIDRSYVLFSTPNYRHSLIIDKKDILEEDSYHIII